MTKPTRRDREQGIIRERGFVAIIVALLAFLVWLSVRIVRERDECMMKPCERGRAIAIRGLCFCAEVPK